MFCLRAPRTTPLSGCATDDTRAESYMTGLLSIDKGHVLRVFGLYSLRLVRGRVLFKDTPLGSVPAEPRARDTHKRGQGNELGVGEHRKYHVGVVSPCRGKTALGSPTFQEARESGEVAEHLCVERVVCNC